MSPLSEPGHGVHHSEPASFRLSPWLSGRGYSCPGCSASIPSTTGPPAWQPNTAADDNPLTPSCIPGGTNHKVSLAVKMIVYTTIGWGLPFFAWKYTEYKVNSN